MDEINTKIYQRLVDREVSPPPNMGEKLPEMNEEPLRFDSNLSPHTNHP
jgi:hypothetical protein